MGRKCTSTARKVLKSCGGNDIEAKHIFSYFLLHLLGAEYGVLRQPPEAGLCREMLGKDWRAARDRPTPHLEAPEARSRHLWGQKSKEKSQTPLEMHAEPLKMRVGPLKMLA